MSPVSNLSLVAASVGPVPIWSLWSAGVLADSSSATTHELAQRLDDLDVTSIDAAVLADLQAPIQTSTSSVLRRADREASRRSLRRCTA